MSKALFGLLVSVSLLLPAPACPSALVISSSEDTQVVRGDNLYTPAVLLPFCWLGFNQAQCIGEDYPISSAFFSYVEFLPLEAWMEASVLSATIVYRASDVTAIVVNGKEACVGTIGSYNLATCSFRQWLVFGTVNEVVVRTNYFLSFEITIGFSQ